MDSWILRGEKLLVKKQCNLQNTTSTQVKVKVSHLLLTDYDEALYGGAITADYPKVLGRAAVGIVTDAGENCYGVEKGMRVYLKPTRACGDCLLCKSGKPKECLTYLSAGRDFDGFLRDFVTCEYTDVAALPDSVDDISALCIENIGIAENIYDKLNLSAGQRVAIIGADLDGLITAQVLLYHKIIPIVIDNNPLNLDKAKKLGVYYAFTADEELEKNVLSATSGNLCSAAICCAGSRMPISLAIRQIGLGKTLVLSCNSTMNATLSASDVIDKNLKVFGVSSAYEYTDTVINMLIHGAVSVEQFEREILSDFDPAAILEERATSGKSNKLTIFKMII